MGQDETSTTHPVECLVNSTSMSHHETSSDKFNVLREMALSGISPCFCCVRRCVRDCNKPELCSPGLMYPSHVTAVKAGPKSLDPLCRDISYGFIVPDSRTQFLDSGMHDNLANSGILEGVDLYLRSPELRAAPSLPANAARSLAVMLDVPKNEGYEVEFPAARFVLRLPKSDLHVGCTGDGIVSNVLDKGEQEF